MGVFFIGAMIGMFIPSMLVVALAVTPGAAEPTVANMPVYAAMELGKKAAWLFPFILILGSMILWKTQTTLLEMMIRNTTDSAIAVSPRLREWIGGDPRKFYYLMAVTFIVAIGIIIHLALPTKLLQSLSEYGEPCLHHLPAGFDLSEPATSQSSAGRSVVHYNAACERRVLRVLLLQLPVSPM